LDPTFTPRDRLAAVLSPDLLDALEALVAERVAYELARLDTARSSARWLTLDQAAERLGCTAAAVRMRAARGRLTTRRHGRRLYVSAASVDELAPGALSGQGA
jgi:excisionase family DNA binding protein